MAIDKDPKGDERIGGCARCCHPSNVFSARWIPVTEKLPENDTEALICIRNGCMFVAKRYVEPNGDGGWDDGVLWDATDDEDVVKAWMPLPEPYKENKTIYG